MKLAKKILDVNFKTSTQLGPLFVDTSYSAVDGFAKFVSSGFGKITSVNSSPTVFIIMFMITVNYLVKRATSRQKAITTHHQAHWD